MKNRPAPGENGTNYKCIMSWKNAKEEARKRLVDLGLDRDLTGEEIDMQELGNKIDLQGRYKMMVLRALARMLKYRKAVVVISPVGPGDSE